MTIKSELEKKIEREKAKILDLRSQLERQEAFVLGLQEALKMLPREAAVESTSRLAGVLRPSSDMYKVRELLRRTRRPMYIADILTGIGEESTKQKRANIGGSLSNYARRGEIFKRTGPNEFSLIELDVEPGRVAANAEPPPGFGSDGRP